MGLQYTTIRHELRKACNLTCNEYVLLDMVYQLAVSPMSKIKGWCYMSRNTMADELGLSKQSVINLIDSLITKGYIIKDNENGHLKTTKNWDILYFKSGKESLPPVKKVVDTGKESLPNNNINNYTLDKSKDIVDLPLNDIDLYTKFINEMNSVLKREFKKVNSTKQLFIARLKAGYTYEQIIAALKNAMQAKNHLESNFNYLTPKFILTADKLEMYSNFKPIEGAAGSNGNDFTIKM